MPQKIPAWLSLAFRVTTAVLGVIITAASGSPEHFGGKEIAGDIAFWLGLVVTVLNTGFSFVGTGAQPSMTVMGKVAAWALAIVVGASLLFQPEAARAEPRHRAATEDGYRSTAEDACQKLDPSTPCADRVAVAGREGKAKGPLPLPIPLPNGGVDLNKAFAAIQAISLDDLKAAKADSDGTKDGLASTCYAALIDLVTAQQAVSSQTLPKVHLVLTFQRGRDIWNALRPGSATSIACAPLAEQVKLDITTLIASIAAGTITMASFGL